MANDTSVQIPGFDAGMFLNTTVDTALPTRTEPVPQGEYLAVIKDLALRTGLGKDQKPYVSLDITYQLDAPEVAAKLNRRDLTVRQSMFIDLNASGGLASGPNQNVKLGKVKEAVGQNKAGVPLGALKGAGPIKVMVGHRADKDDSTMVYDEVKAVAKA